MSYHWVFFLELFVLKILFVTEFSYKLQGIDNEYCNFSGQRRQTCGIRALSAAETVTTLSTMER